MLTIFGTLKRTTTHLQTYTEVNLRKLFLGKRSHKRFYGFIFSQILRIKKLQILSGIRLHRKFMPGINGKTRTNSYIDVKRNSLSKALPRPKMKYIK